MITSVTEPPVLAIDQLTVRYGRRAVVDGVSLHVPAGAVYALLGRNGAGKTSLVRCLLGHWRPEGGTVRIAGLDTWRQRKKAMLQTGVVPEDPDASPASTPAELARFCERVAIRAQG